MIHKLSICTYTELYTHVCTLQDTDGRALIDPFVDLPSKDEYPEYYDYITEPIDMTMIEQKISADRVSA